MNPLSSRKRKHARLGSQGLSQDRAVGVSVALNGNNQFTRDIRTWGLNDVIVNNYAKMGITELFKWQVDCLSTESRAAIHNGRSIVYSAPTGCGKTLVAEILLARRLLPVATNHDMKALIVLPYLSVVAEKTGYFKTLFHRSGVPVQELTSSSEAARPGSTWRIGICSMERANALINRMLEHVPGQLDPLRQIGIIIIDEVHMIGEGRGERLESLLSKIKYWSSSKAGSEHHIQIVGLSATLPSNIDDLADWLNAIQYTGASSPVTIDEFVVSDCGEVIGRDAKLCRPVSGRSAHQIIVELAIETLLEGQSVLVFCFTKLQCPQIAKELGLAAQKLLPPPSNEIAQLRQELIDQLNVISSGALEALEKTIVWGIAYHHGGLLQEERSAIEAAYRQGTLSCLACTSTLSTGVNIPAGRVIIKFQTGRGYQMTTSSYRQMRGRAGRVGQSASRSGAQSYIIVNKLQVNMALNIFINGDIPPLSSQFAESGLTSIVLDGIGTGIVKNKDDLLRLVQSTFLRYQIDADQLAVRFESALMAMSDDTCPFLTRALDTLVDRVVLGPSKLGEAAWATGMSERSFG